MREEVLAFIEAMRREPQHQAVLIISRQVADVLGACSEEEQASVQRGLDGIAASFGLATPVEVRVV
jgi:hypothetical protein